MDREDSGGTASQSHFFPLAAQTLVSTPGLPVKVLPQVQVSLPGQKLTCSLLTAPHRIRLLIGRKRTGTHALFICICRHINVDACMFMHVWAYSACVSTAPCVKIIICSNAHVAANVHMFCQTAKWRYIIVSCQGDIAGEVELQTHVSLSACQGTAWTIRISLQTFLALHNFNACYLCEMTLISLLCN